MGRRAGKTETALQDLVKRAVELKGLYWYVSPSYRQSKQIAWFRLKQILKNDEYWKFNEQELSAYHPILETRIELKGADNEDSLRGVGLNGVVLDECAIMKPNVWPEIIRPMLADRNGWALFISTPKGRNWFYDMFSRANNDINWRSWNYPTTVNAYVKGEEIQQARKDMSERLFKQEFMAEFLDDDTGVFKGVRRCAVGQLKPPELGRFYVMGVDLAKTEDFTVLSVIDSATRNLVSLDRFQDISWSEQKLRIQDLALKYNNALCIVDSTGVGDPIFEDLQNSGVSCQGYKFTNESKHRLIEQLAIVIEQRQITFPNIDYFVQELMNYEYSITESGRIVYSAPSGKHDDCVISLGLAVWGIRSGLKEAQVLDSVTNQRKYDFNRSDGGIIEHKDPYGWSGVYNGNASETSVYSL